MKSISEIVRLASNYVGAALPPLTHQSPPIPVRTERDIAVAFLYYHGEVVDAQKKFQVWPPSYLASFRLGDGQFQEIVAFTPSAIGFDHDLAVALGTGFSPPEKMNPSYISQLARYCQSVDLLLPTFSAQAKIADDLRSAAKDAVGSLSAILEPPLRPFVERVGSNFFRWLNAA